MLVKYVDEKRLLVKLYVDKDKYLNVCWGSILVKTW